MRIKSFMFWVQYSVIVTACGVVDQDPLWVEEDDAELVDGDADFAAEVDEPLTLPEQSVQDSAAPSAVGCTWSGCNNMDPVAMGCTAGAQIFSSAFISVGNTYLAKIDAMYSSTCGSQWTRITNWSIQPPQALEASQATGWYDAIYGWQLTKFTIGAGGYVPYGYSINSPMMSAAYSLRACGEWRVPGSIYKNCTGYY
jgi:hypothetical protein